MFKTIMAIDAVATVAKVSVGETIAIQLQAHRLGAVTRFVRLHT